MLDVSNCLLCVCLIVSRACLSLIFLVVLVLLHDFVQEWKRLSVGDFDEPLLSHVFLPLSTHLD